MGGRIASFVALLAMALWPVGPLRAQPPTAARTVLLTPDEAERLRLTDDESREIVRPRALSAGPRIVVQAPRVKETEAGPTMATATPFDLFVVFEPYRAPVDMDSLNVRARKGLFTKSLTALLGPFVHDASVRATGLEVPEGRFLVEIEIADRDGAKTISVYRLEVARRQ